MRMKLSCTTRGLFFLAATVLLTAPVLAQYYTNGNPNQGYRPHQAYGPQYSGGYVGGQQFMPGPQHTQAHYPQTQYATQPKFAPQSQFAYQPQYMAMAQQPVANGNLPAMNQTLEAVPPGTSMQPSNNHAPQQAPMDYQQGGQPQGGYENYTAGACATGSGCENYGSYCQPNYSCGDVGYGCCAPCGPRRHWFGGVYGLLMERVTCDRVPLAFYTPQPAPGYYPTDSEIALTTDHLDNELQGGAEVRFGATFACCGGAGGYGGCCDPCGGGCGTLGWEVGYWALAEDTAYASYTDGPATRTYGMKSYQGLEFNHGGAWRPVNHAYDYAPPTQDYIVGGSDLRVTSVETTRSFSVQNVEWNLVCLPTIGGGCNSSCGMGGGSCDSCGGGCCDSCGGGSCGAGGCGHRRCGGGCGAYCYTGPRCQCSTSLGVRYLRFDEDFMYRSNYDEWIAGVYDNSNSIAHYIDADNHLVGFQVGGNGCYHLGCCGKVALHFSSNAGIYGNYIEVDQYWSRAVRFANGTQDAFNINADDENIAFVGELRLGASYQCSCHCRLYGGYRALGVSGVALSTSQLAQSPYITPGQSGYVDCSGSIFLHGLQSGVEFMY